MSKHMHRELAKIKEQTIEGEIVRHGVRTI